MPLYVYLHGDTEINTKHLLHIIASIKMDIMGFMIIWIKLHSFCLSLFTHIYIYILGLHIYVARWMHLQQLKTVNKKVLRFWKVFDSWKMSCWILKWIIQCYSWTRLLKRIISKERFIHVSLSSLGIGLDSSLQKRKKKEKGVVWFSEI